MKISLLTATYNRKEELKKLYDSLNNNYQTFKDFEWIVMDDGSSDGTKEQLAEWINVAPFEIKYHYQQNKGKQREINDAIQYGKTNVIVNTCKPMSNWRKTERNNAIRCFKYVVKD